MASGASLPQRHDRVASVGRSNHRRLLIRLFRPVRALPISRNALGPCNSNDRPNLDHSATQPAIALAQAAVLLQSPSHTLAPDLLMFAAYPLPLNNWI
jgi:hypothetical protein